MSISGRWLTDIEEFRAISGAWDTLVSSSEEDNPFLLSDFIITWWKHYSSDSHLRIFVVYDETRLIGGLPLCLNKARRLEYTGGINANYTQILSAGNKPVIWRALFESLAVSRDWRILQLKRYNHDSLNPDEYRLKSEANRRRILFDLCAAECSYLVKLEGIERFEDYYDKLPKKLRYYVKRSMNEFARLGNISLDHLTDAGMVDTASEQFIKFSRSSFRRRKEWSNFEDPKYCLFFKELMLKLDAAGRLDANVLKLNDRPIAFHFGFSTGRNLNYIFTTFDIELAGLNPGHLLIYKLIELGSKRKNKFFDMYTGRAFYKEQWSDHKEKIAFIEMRPDSPLSRVERSIVKNVRNAPIIGNIKSLMRRSGTITRVGRKVKEFVQHYT